MARSRGFTLVEVLVVLSLLGVLMGLSIGLIANAQTGNKLIVAANTLDGQFAAARAQSFGSNTAYVVVHTEANGKTSFRNYRDTQVFAWAAEDFAKASEDVLRRGGGVEISTESDLEGKYAVFQPNGTIELGDPPWLDFLDGFTIQCRLKCDARGGALFRKGESLAVNLMPGSGGRLGIEARIRLQKDAKGEGDGSCVLRTGNRDSESAMVPEWTAPLIPGRWHDVRIAYDRNTFTIHVDGRLRAIRSDRKSRMVLNDQGFAIGGGYSGGFDSLVIAGIFESDENRFDCPDVIRRVGPDGKVAAGDLLVHFRNRGLDPQYHASPVQIHLEMEQGADKPGIRRVVVVSLSGESAVKRTEEVR